MSDTTYSGVSCNGDNGNCPETFTVTDTGKSQTDPSSLDCGGRCK